MKRKPLWAELGEFGSFVFHYFRRRLWRLFKRFELGKGLLVEGLYQKRGKYARPFIHSGMVGLVLVGVTLGPLVIERLPSSGEAGGALPNSLVLGQTDVSAETLLSDKPRAEVLNYTVQEGDTLSSVADKFGVSLETVLWANDLTEKSKIKPGQQLAVPPVTGIIHKVKRGETIYSVAKKYDIEAQSVVNWPFNSYVNDETFALAVGQILVVPDGVMPEAAPSTSRYIARRTPDAGAVTATGQFVWPTQGSISQRPVWYHMAVDISNKGAPDILAADSGTVVVAGTPDRYGYGTRVMIDHGNGFQTLYAHMSAVYVSSGQRVSRGVAVGRMGCTGRCSGTHLHFEIRQNGVLQNPLGYLQ